MIGILSSPCIIRYTVQSGVRYFRIAVVFSISVISSFKIEFKIKIQSEDVDILIDDAEIISDTTFEDFLYTY